jgi:hypothetical protein
MNVGGGARGIGVAWLPRTSAALVVNLLLVVAAALAADLQRTEYQIKAAFLCKFGNFVDWPAAAASQGLPFLIGVVASDDVIDELTRAATGQTVAGRPIAVRRYARDEPVDGLSILYVARTHSERIAHTLAAAKGHPVLTVTESDRGTAVGSMLNFVIVDDKVKFDIAIEAAEQAGLKISARLLSVARSVSGRSV